MTPLHLRNVSIREKLFKQLKKHLDSSFKNGFWMLMVFIFTVMLPSTVQSKDAKELRYVNEHWPPYIIFDEHDNARGIDIEILKEIADHLGVRLNIMKCDWFYCLKMIKLGRADMISAALKRPEREKYMLYIEPPYILKSTKLFYLQKGKGNLIKKYEDLNHMTIGVLKGSSYFPRFDNDLKIQKIEVLKTEQLLRMLRDGRIDTFIGTELVVDYLIQSNSHINLFDKSLYKYDLETPFYFAISKQSSFSERIFEINEIMDFLLKNCSIQTILNKYNKVN